MECLRSCSSRYRVYVVVLVMALGLAGCGGSSSSPSGPAVSNVLSNVPSNVPSTTSMHPVPVRLTYLLPRSTESRARRRPEYISSSNTLITITVTPIGGSSTPYGPWSCSPLPGTCTIIFTTTPGLTNIAFALTDNGSSHLLSSFSTTVFVQPSTINTFTFTANPVVSSVALIPANTTVKAGTPANQLLTLQATDADGKIIVGNANYVDVNGNPVGFNITVSNNQAGGQGTVNIQGAPYVTAPGQAAIYAHYDGNWLASSTISVTSTSSSVTSLTGATLKIKPYAYAYTVGGTLTPYGITVGPDGRLWFTLLNSSSAVGAITPSGVYTLYPCGSSVPRYITTASDGNLYFTDSNDALGEISTNGVYNTISIPANGGNAPRQIISGIAGKLWYSGTYINNMTTSDVTTSFSISGDQATALAFGPNQNIWYLDNTNGTVNTMNQNGTILASYADAGLVPSATSDGMILGPDGNLWFDNWGKNSIDSITTNGSITHYPLQSGAQPQDITIGPDGNIWFSEDHAGSIGELSTTGSLNEYGASNGISGAAPVGIVTGPDGNIWFTDYAGGRVYKFVL